MTVLLNNPVFILGAMALIVFGVTQGLKWIFIKPFTKKIKNERIKKLLNISILVLAFLVALLVEFLYSKFWLNSLDLSLVRAYTGWTGSTAVYAWIERFLNKKLEDPFSTEEGKCLKKLAQEAVKDNKIDSKDKSAVEEFWEKVNHE